MVSIAAFQAVDPGSIPGRRIHFPFFKKKIFLMTKSGMYFEIDQILRVNFVAKFSPAFYWKCLVTT